MEDKNALKDLSTILTTGIFFTYIIGYLVVTGFLSKYEIFNDDLLNLNFLRAGFVFLMILVPILLIIHSNFYKHIEDQKQGFVYHKFIFKKILKTIALSLLSTTFLLPLFINYKNFNYNVLYLYGIAVAICVFSYLVFIAFYFIKVKKLSLGYFISILIWLCLASYFFGSHVFEDLPKSFKGGFPDSTYILCKKETINYLNNIGFNFDSTNFSDKVVIFYSSNNKLLIKEKNGYYFLSKELFNGFKTLNGNK